jgi:hypothetical protein
MPNDGIDASQDIDSGNTKHGDMPRGQPLIAFRPITPIMSFAIDLNGKPPAGAEEIQHKGAGRMLATKLESVRSRPQRTPEQYFR